MNDTHVIMTSWYSRCMTQRIESYGSIIYDNLLLVHLKPRLGVTFDVPDVEFAITCQFKRNPLSRINVTSYHGTKILSYDFGK